jgi:hypothetical protein
MRDGPEVDPRACLSDFADEFFGLIGEAQASWLDAMVDLFEHAPARNAWVAALHLESQSNESLQAVDLRAEIDTAQAIAEELARVRPHVTDNIQCYDRLLLVSDLLVHTWQRAAQFCEDRLDAQTLADSEQLLARLSDTWDCDRYIDDPRKWTPVLDCDGHDHLLSCFKQGTEVVRRAVGLETQAAPA